MEQPTEARKTQLEVLEETSIATLKSSYSTWRAGVGRSRIVDLQFQTDGTNYTLMILYAEG